jgi:intracellular multiplication protein IcmO
MSDKKFSGVQDSQRINPEDVVVNTTPLRIRFSEWLKIPNNVVFSLSIMAGLCWYYPAASAWVFLAAAWITFWAKRQKEMAPLKMPIQSKILDSNQPHPGNGKATPGQGIFFIGNDMKNGKEIWLTNDDCRQHFLILGTTGAGKALPLDAKVHTPLGWRLLGELKRGDLVTTPDGRSAPISGYFPQGKLDICLITFEDGRTAEVSPDHLWEIHHKLWTDRYKAGVSRAGTSQPTVLTTRQLKDLLDRNTGTFSVRLAEAVEKPEAALPIPPYLLGAMIGDGNLINRSIARFTTADDHILETVSAEIPADMELHQHESSRPYDWNVRFWDSQQASRSDLRKAFGDLGLLGVTSVNKFIPQIYKDGTIAQRWAIVQGLMDADGSCDGRKVSLNFSTSSARLAADLQDIVRSLGGLASISPDRRTSYEQNGEVRLGSPSYRVSIRHPEPSKFFTLPCKVALVDEPYRNASRLKLGVAKVEMNVRRAEAACIMVDHPDHLFITDNYVVTHNTETLLGFAANALTWGSGVLFCDGKGDVSLFSKIYVMARRFGREDDILVLNFMTGNRDPSASGGKILSNTLNPFSTGSSDGLTQMVTSLMDDAGGDSMWQGRAIALLTGIMRALCWLRDQGFLDLNVSELRDTMSLKKIIELADINAHPDLPPHIRKSIRSYLSSLPGFQEDKGVKQSSTTLDQHGYLEMQFTKILGTLADVYGHIFATPQGEIDMYDVVLGRRILVIMLPALEKAGSEIANLGKIVVATLKDMMGSTLGSEIEGKWKQVVDNRPTNSPSPFVVIMDEVGYYTVDGMALMAAQARSLGFSLCFAAQDTNSMERLNEKEAASIIANTNTKIFMKTEDPNKTTALAVARGQKTLRTRLGGYDRKVGGFAGQYATEGDSASFEEADVIHGSDLAGQLSGEMHVINGAKVIRAKGFYAQPEGSLELDLIDLRANHFIKVARPSGIDIGNGIRAPEILARLMDDKAILLLKKEADDAVANLEKSAGTGDEIALAVTAFDRMIASGRNTIEASGAAIAEIVRVMTISIHGFEDSVKGGFAATSIPRGSDMFDPERGGGLDFGSEDGFEPEEEDEDPRARRRTIPRDFDMAQETIGSADPFANPVGVPLVARTDPPFAVPPRPPRLPPNLGRKPQTVDQNVRHGATVDGGGMIDMADRMASNDAIMSSLAALNFDGDQVTSSQVEARIEEALGGIGSSSDSAWETNRLNERVAGFDRAAHAAQPMVPTQASRTDLQDDEDEDGGDEGNVVTSFLDGLMAKDDDD